MNTRIGPDSACELDRIAYRGGGGCHIPTGGLQRQGDAERGDQRLSLRARSANAR